MAMPNLPVPELKLPTVDGGILDLAALKPPTFTMLVFSRGLHCPICKGYLGELERKLDDFAKLGVFVAAASTDTGERAERTKSEWGLDRLRIAYDLPIEKARELGLYISSSIKNDEPPEFAEPGLFLIRPDRTLYCASIQTMPFARPAFSDVLRAVSFVIEKDYPARGAA